MKTLTGEIWNPASLDLNLYKLLETRYL